MSNNYFAELNAINVQDKIEKKNGLSYLSWAWAWAELKKKYPEANYTIYENKDGLFYHTDGNTCWVKTGVTVNGIEHIEYLPVMDYRNASIPVSKVTSFDVNKAIQRSLTKAVARHGLGLYVYAGEDLPEEETKEAEHKPIICEHCGNEIVAYKGKNGKLVSVAKHCEASLKQFNSWLCLDCIKKEQAAERERREFLEEMSAHEN